MKLRAVFFAVAALAAASLLFAGVDLTNAKCPIAGGPANEATAVDYKGGKVYFCCGGCDKTFQADTAKYAAKANQQLFVTGQAMQTYCPLTGEENDENIVAKIAGAPVQFCCAHCRDSATQGSEEEQLEKVFSDESFEKGFKVLAD